MATSITHKNTGVKNKEVRPDQLAFGEFAINWHESGPFVQVKDADGDIIRVGGVIIQDEQPALGQKGAFWLSLAKDTLFIYTGDNWHPIGGGGDGGGEAPLPPVVNNGKLTIQLEDGTVLGTFTANQAGDGTVTIPASPDPAPPTWEGIEGKPDCFEPCEHEHPATPWPDIPEKPDCFEPCEHTHPPTAWPDIPDKPDCFDPCPHRHDASEIDNLPEPPEPIQPNDGKLTIKDEDDNVLGEFTANQGGDTEVVVPAGGGGGLDCAGVVDCFNNAPIDPARVSIAVNVLKDFFEDPADEPDHWPEGQDHSVYMYADICDPVSHEIIPFVPREEHGHAALSGSILRLPHAYYRPTYCVITPSPPITRLEDAKEIYGEHPDILAIPDLKLFRGKYIKGVTTTDDLWNTGDAVEDPLTDSQTIKLDLPKCDSWTVEETKSGGEWHGCNNWDDLANDGMYFYRFEFAWKRIGTFNLVLLMNHDRKSITIQGDTGGPTYFVNEDLPNIQIKPMEDN